MYNSLHTDPAHSNTVVPALHVRIVTDTATFRRSRNGAWLPGGSKTEVQVVPESQAVRFVSGHYASSACTVSAYWPDGHAEFFDFYNVPLRFSAYGPHVQTELVDSPCGETSYQRELSRLGRVGYYGLEPFPAREETT